MGNKEEDSLLFGQGFSSGARAVFKSVSEVIEHGWRGRARIMADKTGNDQHQS